MTRKRKKTQTSSPGTQETKSPVTILNEIKQGITYKFIDQSGPKNPSIFTYLVEFDNKKFIGEGKSKNLAKAAAAECALLSIIQSPKSNSIVKKSKIKKTANFNSDKTVLKKPTFEEDCTSNNQTSKLPDIIAERSVAILNDIYPGLVYQFITQSGPKNAPIFTYLIEFDGKKFIRNGKTKNLAKYAVAKCALESIIQFPKHNSVVNINEINSNVNFTGDHKNSEKPSHERSCINENESLKLPTIMAERSVAILSRIQERLTYQFIGQSDSKLAPTFIYSVEFDGKKFIGEGNNKIKAKTAAAECALLSIIYSPKNNSKIDTNAIKNTANFTSDNNVNEKPTSEEGCIILNQSPKLSAIVTEPSAAISKEIKQETNQPDTKHVPIFTFSVEFDGTKFIHKEKKKNLSKAASAECSPQSNSTVDTSALNSTVSFTGDNTNHDKPMQVEKCINDNESSKLLEVIAERSVSILNQIHPGLTYKFIGQSDPKDTPIFTYSVEFDCTKLIDEEKNKNLTKTAAAERALQFIIHSFRNNSTVDTNNINSTVNFTADNTVNEKPMQEESCMNHNTSPKLPEIIAERTLAILNHIYQGLKYKLISRSGPKKPRIFTYSVEYEGTKSIGKGKSKNLAKAAAAECALLSIIHSPNNNSKIDTNAIENTDNFTSDNKVHEKLTSEKGCIIQNQSSKLPAIETEPSATISKEIKQETNQPDTKHVPIFTFSVKFDGIKFIHKEKKKNLSKAASAECSPQSNSTVDTSALNSTVSFTGDNTNHDKPMQVEKCINDNESSKLPKVIAERSVSILNQIHPGLTYKFIGQSDPKETPIFTYSVEFDCTKLIDEGKNKNLTKTVAAERALQFIIHSFRNNSTGDTSNIKSTVNFTGDNTVNEKPMQEESCMNHNTSPKLPEIITERTLAILNHIYQGLKYKLISRSGPKKPRIFTYSVEYEGTKSIGKGKTKDLAKAAAAKCALLSIKYSLNNDSTIHTSAIKNTANFNSNETILEEPKLSKLPTFIAERSVAILNEIHRKITYKFIGQSGPKHAPIFTYLVEFDGKKFIGEGKSKNLAKYAAAEYALLYIMHSPKNNSKFDKSALNSTNDNKVPDIPMQGETCINGNESSKLPDVMAERSVTILNQIHPGLTYKFIDQSGLKNAPIFNYSVEIDGKKFIGEGKNKNLAKAAAAERALLSIIYSPKNNSKINKNTINNTDNFTSGNKVRKKPTIEEGCIIQNQSPKLPAIETEPSAEISKEIQQGLTYQFIGQSGSKHAPIFTYMIEFDGKKFIGKGKNKSLAKFAAAEYALESIIQSPKNNSMINTTAINNTYNFSSGNTVHKNPIYGDSCINHNQSAKLPTIKAGRSVVVSNEIQRGLTYQLISQSGPQHAPIFTFSVEFNGKKFIGEGKNTNLAKAAAVECALLSIIHSPKNDSKININAIDSTVNFTGDNKVRDKPMQVESCMNNNESSKLPTIIAERSVSILNEIHRGLTYKFNGQSGPKNAPIFTYSVEIDGTKFIGEGEKKNLAKYAVAERALQSIIHSRKNDLTVDTSKVNYTGVHDKPICINGNESSKLPEIIAERSVTILNQIHPRLTYKFIGQSGPKNAPIFIYSVEIDGKKFIGEGKNKNFAKAAAAEGALLYIIHTPKNDSKINTNSIKSTVNATSDKTVLEKPTSQGGCIILNQPPKFPAAKGPVEILNNMYPGLSYECVFLNNSVAKFKMTVKVEDELFFGTGGSKKLAKEAAARAALSKICNISPSTFSMPNVNSSALEYTQKRLTCTNTTIKKHEIIASITMNEKYLPENTKLTYVTSMECKSGDINVQKTGINDIRAEIEARRHLIDLLRKQLENLPSFEAESKMENGNKETRKRPLEDQSEMSMKRKKTLILSPVTLATKSPVAILNEVKQGLTYQLISQSGPTHAPLFAYSVDIDGEKFIGEGKNKKLAKAAAARNALQSFIQFPKNNSMVNISTINDNVDFTSDDIVQEKPKNGVSNIVQSPKIPAVVAKGPVMILNEMFPGLTYECESLNDSVAKFKMSVEVKGELFFGTGGSKKHAKAAAARAALSKICNMSPSTFSMPNVNSSPAGLMHKRTIPQMLVDYIGELVLQKFDSLTRDNTTIQKRKVIAGIVMTENYSLESTKLICVTTGTKCISGDHISVQGAAINDTHAEIVARRCLIDFLYTQLENLTSFGTSSKETIFKPRDDNSNGYTLKEGIKFHLYINTAPCGDARIFSPHEIEDKGLLDKHPNRKARGQLRTKIESGEGTIPVASSGGIQTWDGVLQGERLLTMSCSDKICRWNVLGVQGALLTNFIDPIYLDSIILGSLLHPEHMCRAIYGRIETTIQALPPPFKLNKPETNLLSSSETRRAAKAPNFSVNWTVGLPEAEVINSMTGKTEYGGMSRICKQMFFRRFLNLVGNIKSLTKFPENEVITMYSQAKQLASDYQTAKKQLYMAFEKAYLGAWLKKPIEQDQFEL